MIATSLANLPHSALARVFLVSLGILAAPALLHAQTILNGGFETPVAPAGNFVEQPSQASSSWLFGNFRTGISAANGPWAPLGTVTSQFAYLQNGGGTTGIFSQSINFSSAGDFTLSYLEGSRAFHSDVSYDVTLTKDSNSSVTFLVSENSGANQPFTLVSYSVTIPTAGAYTLTFAGVDTGSDRAAAFDNIAFTSAVPEPATYAIMFGVAALGLAVWRRKRNGQA